MLDGDGGAYLPKPANRLNTIEGRYACLTRNRDFNGDGEISGDELRWYTPSLDQVLGIWVGEPGLPSAESALYTNDTQNLSTDKKFDSNSQYPILPVPNRREELFGEKKDVVSEPIQMQAR